MKTKRGLLILLAISTVSIAATACQNKNQPIAEETTVVTTTEAAKNSVVEENGSQTSVDYDKDEAYLSTYFNVVFPKDTVEEKEFCENIAKITDSDLPQDTEWLAAIKELVDMSGYKELALSYTEEKTKRQLSTYGITKEIINNGQYLACALDTKLISPEDAQDIINNKAMKRAQAERILMNMADARGEARNYLGYSEDEDIYGKVDHAWDSFILYNSDKLSEIGITAVQNKIVTGFNLKNKSYDAKFLPNLTLQYGHSDIKHAHQLIGLLNSEDIQAKIQLEPKVSVYEYLLDWGPIPESTPTYEVRKVNDNMYLVYAVEYELKMEFDNEEDMMNFDTVINTYAKKNAGNEEAIGLIYHAWWQPLYNTTYANMPKDAYNEIGDCILEDGNYELHTYCLKKDEDAVVKSLKEIDPSIEVKLQTRYCNTAFYHYLSGEDYQ